jgi:release factor glutamine methyltransferase
MLVMEHADVQGPAARELAEAHGGFEEVATAADLTGRDRFLLARRRGDDSQARRGRLSR